MKSNSDKEQEQVPLAESNLSRKNYVCDDYTKI